MNMNKILEMYKSIKQFKNSYSDKEWDDFTKTLETVKLNLKSNENMQIEERIDDFYDFLYCLNSLIDFNDILNRIDKRDYYSNKPIDFEGHLKSYFQFGGFTNNEYKY